MQERCQRWPRQASIAGIVQTSPPTTVAAGHGYDGPHGSGDDRGGFAGMSQQPPLFE